MDKLPQETGWMDRSDQSERPGSWAFQLALCLLGPLFFVSYILVLAPLPLLYLHIGTPDARRGRFWFLVAVAIGLALSFAIHGWLWGALFFLLFAALPALVIGELLLKKLGPEKAVVGAVLAVTLATALSGYLVTHSRGLSLIPALKASGEQAVRAFADHMLAQDRTDVPETTLESLKALKEKPSEAFPEVPGLLAAMLLFLCAVPCVALIRWNPKGFLRRTGISRDFLRKWRSPEWLAIPALACWGFHLVEVQYLSDLAQNLEKPILLIYFFHGMSILAYFLDSLRLRGPFRVIFYGTTLLVWPMIVSFGFFDLWFNFRSRNRSVSEE